MVTVILVMAGVCLNLRMAGVDLWYNCFGEVLLKVCYSGCSGYDHNHRHAVVVHALELVQTSGPMQSTWMDGLCQLIFNWCLMRDINQQSTVCKALLAYTSPTLYVASMNELLNEHASHVLCVTGGGTMGTRHILLQSGNRCHSGTCSDLHGAAVF